MAENAPIDFVLHGGDMIDGTSLANLRRARDLFRLSVPVYLSLGNHDLTVPEARDLWLAEAPAFFPGGAPEFTLRLDGCAIHALTTHWCERPFFWEQALAPHFLAGVLERVEATVAAQPGLNHLLLTHSPVVDVPPEQRGSAQPFHLPPPAFTEAVLAAAHRRVALRCLLGAHNHANLHVVAGGTHAVTVSAFVETPFEFKLFEVTPGTVRMSTHGLLPRVGFAAAYDFDRAWVQGRPCDRAFEEMRA